jgi:hypothetical protein
MKLLADQGCGGDDVAVLDGLNVIDGLVDEDALLVVE